MKMEFKNNTWKQSYIKDYSDVLIKEDVMEIQTEQLNYIKNEAQRFINRANTKALNNLNAFFPNQGYNHSVTEFVKTPENVKFYRRSILEDHTTLTLIQANVACYDGELLCDILISKGISYNTLALLSRDIDNLKLLSQLTKRLDELLKKDTNPEQLKLLKTIIEKLGKENELLNIKINEIAKIFKDYYALTDINVIIARLLQITVFERNMYKEKEKTKTK